MPKSPYLTPGFYDRALAQNKHRDIVGGRWDETGRVQMALLMAEGLTPADHLLDVGAGSLRLGCKVVPYLDPGHYWATDQSRALMLRGHQVELPDPVRLSADHLIEDASFDFPGVPDTITHLLAFALFTHLPLPDLALFLTTARARFPNLRRLLFTVFVADPAAYDRALRQPDGVVTHSTRAPYHHLADQVLTLAHAPGWTATLQPDRLPRGQILCRAVPV